MLKGFWKLTWIEIKVFLREPMGVIGSLLIPVVVFVLLGRLFGSVAPEAAVENGPPFNIAVFGGIFIAMGSALSLVAIISIYREGGILKRLRATPLSPITILGSHVVVKLAFTAVALGLLVLVGKRVFPGALDVDLVSFTLALLLSTVSIISVGFIIASLVPTARFAQPIASAILYPMLALSFIPMEVLPAGWRIAALSLPTTHAVSLMTTIWDGGGWMPAWTSIVGLVAVFVVSTAISARVFRWE
jgi:ABC-2 type transport system permease protein